MMKSNPKKKAAESKKSEIKDVKKEGINKDKDNDNNLDFGGLPNRDLKKNLGCG